MTESTIKKNTCQHNTDNNGGFDCPICCRRAGNKPGFSLMALRMRWNCGCDLKNANGSSPEETKTVKNNFSC